MGLGRKVDLGMYGVGGGHSVLGARQRQRHGFGKVHGEEQQKKQ